MKDQDTLAAVVKELYTRAAALNEPDTMAAAMKELDTMMAGLAEPAAPAAVQKEPDTLAAASKEPGTLAAVPKKLETLEAAPKEPGTLAAVRKKPDTWTAAPNEPDPVATALKDPDTRAAVLKKPAHDAAQRSSGLAGVRLRTSSPPLSIQDSTTGRGRATPMDNAENIGGSDQAGDGDREAAASIACHLHGARRPTGAARATWQSTGQNGRTMKVRGRAASHQLA